LEGVDDGVLVEVLGSEGADVVKVIGRPMGDTDISRKLDCETSRVRVVLNELLVKNLVRLNRRRHDSGYCDYSWVRRDDKIREYVNGYFEGRIRELDSMVSDVEGIVFECGCRRVDYGTAIELGFTCPDCGGDFSRFDVSRDGGRLRSELMRLKALKDAS